MYHLDTFVALYTTSATFQAIVFQIRAYTAAHVARHGLIHAVSRAIAKGHFTAGLTANDHLLKDLPGVQESWPG